MAAVIIAEVDNLMSRTVPTEDNIANVDLFISYDRFKRSDLEIFKLFILDRVIDVDGKEHPGQSRHKIALQQGDFTRPLTTSQKCFLVIIMGLYRVFSIWYHVLYYYFAPFFVAFLVIYSNLLKSEDADPTIISSVV